MAFEKAARRETQRLWRAEVPCALASVRAGFQPSVWCVCAHVSMCVSVCGCWCMCAGYHRGSMHSEDYRGKKKQTKGREMGDDSSSQGCSHVSWRVHLSARVTLTVLFSSAGQAENRESTQCQSEGEHPLFKSREERTYQLYRGRVNPLRKKSVVKIHKYTMQTWTVWIQEKTKSIEPRKFVRRLLEPPFFSCHWKDEDKQRHKVASPWPWNACCFSIFVHSPAGMAHRWTERQKEMRVPCRWDSMVRCWEFWWKLALTVTWE